MAELMCASQRLAQVNYSDRMRTVRKLALTIQTQAILRKADTVQVTRPVAQDSLEDLILTYIQTGHLQRLDAQDLLQALVLLVRCHPHEIYPHTWEGREVRELIDNMGEEEGDLMVDLMDLFQKLVEDGLLTTEYASAYLADAVVNYKTSTKRFQRIQRFLLSTLQPPVSPMC